MNRTPSIQLGIVISLLLFSQRGQANDTYFWTKQTGGGVVCLNVDSDEEAEPSHCEDDLRGEPSPTHCKIHSIRNGIEMDENFLHRINLRSPRGCKKKFGFPSLNLCVPTSGLHEPEIEAIVDDISVITEHYVPWKPKLGFKPLIHEKESEDEDGEISLISLEPTTPKSPKKEEKDWKYTKTAVYLPGFKDHMAKTSEEPKPITYTGFATNNEDIQAVHSAIQLGQGQAKRVFSVDAKTKNGTEELAAYTFFSSRFEGEEFSKLSAQFGRLKHELSIYDRVQSIRGVAKKGTVIPNEHDHPDSQVYSRYMHKYTGGNLSEAVKKSSLHLKDINDLTRKLCQITSEIHKKDVVVRDIKPENIFVERNPDGSIEPVLGDFDQAYHKGEDFLKTKDFVPVGVTVKYSNPQFFKSKKTYKLNPDERFEVDKRQDWFTVGMTLLEAINHGESSPWQERDQFTITGLKQSEIDHYRKQSIQRLIKSGMPGQEAHQINQVLRCTLQIVPTKNCSEEKFQTLYKAIR